MKLALSVARQYQIQRDIVFMVLRLDCLNGDSVAQSAALSGSVRAAQRWFGPAISAQYVLLRGLRRVGFSDRFRV